MTLTPERELEIAREARAAETKRADAAEQALQALRLTLVGSLTKAGEFLPVEGDVCAPGLIRSRIESLAARARFGDEVRAAAVDGCICGMGRAAAGKHSSDCPKNTWQNPVFVAGPAINDCGDCGATWADGFEKHNPGCTNTAHLKADVHARIVSVDFDTSAVEEG